MKETDKEELEFVNHGFTPDMEIKFIVVAIKDMMDGTHQILHACAYPEEPKPFDIMLLRAEMRDYMENDENEEYEFRILTEGKLFEEFKGQVQQSLRKGYN